MTAAKKSTALSDEVGQFAILPRWVLFRAPDGPKLSDAAKLLYAAIWAHTNEATRVAFPSRRTLASELSWEAKKVDRALAELVAIDAVSVTRRKRPGTQEWTSSEYRLARSAPEVGSVCLPPGADEVGVRMGPRRGQDGTTVGVKMGPGRGQDGIAELDVPNETQPNETTQRLTTSPKVAISDQPSRSSSSSVDVGIRIAAGRVADKQASAGGFRSSRSAFIAGVVRSFESEQVDVLRRARSEDWSSERLADALVPPPPPVLNDRVARLPDGRRAFTAGSMGHQAKRVFDMTEYVPARVVA